MTTVVVVEDEPLLRAGLRELLSAENDLVVVGEAENGAAAIEVIAATGPDVALVDVRMPEMDGIEVTRRVTRGPGGTRVLLLTTFASEEYLIEGLRAGASGFLVKSASPEQVIAAIHSVAGGDSIVAPAMTRSLIDRAVSRAHEEPLGVSDAATTAWHAPPEKRSTGAPLPALSARELDVLRLMAQGRSDKAIARALEIAVPTVKSHVHRVLTKLEVSSRTQAALAARDAGVLIPG